jgi:hypothetical protein
MHSTFMMGVTDATIRNGARCPIFGPAAQNIAAIFLAFRVVKILRPN